MDSWRQSVSSSFMVQKNGFKRSSSGIDGTPKQWEAEFAELRLEKKNYPLSWMEPLCFFMTT